MSIAKKMNPYLSDLCVMFYKLHDLHWNVKGDAFVQVHLYTESRYDDMADKLDAVAELMIMNGEKPVSTMKEYLELATIQELGKETYQDKEALKEVLADLEHLKKEALEVREAMDSEGVFTAVAMMEEHVAGYDKEIWFLKSILA